MQSDPIAGERGHRPVVNRSSGVGTPPPPPRTLAPGVGALGRQANGLFRTNRVPRVGQGPLGQHGKGLAHRRLVLRRE